MISQTATRETICDTCGMRVTRYITQLIHRDQLRWDLEGVCSACTNQFHTGGPGELPEGLREALLSTHGPARLRLQGESRQQVIVMKVLREVLDLSVREAEKAVHELRRAGPAGTYVEMEFLAQRLRVRGVNVIVEHP